MRPAERLRTLTRPRQPAAATAEEPKRVGWMLPAPKDAPVDQTACRVRSQTHLPKAPAAAAGRYPGRLATARASALGPAHPPSGMSPRRSWLSPGERFAAPRRGLVMSAPRPAAHSAPRAELGDAQAQTAGRALASRYAARRSRELHADPSPRPRVAHRRQCSTRSARRSTQRHVCQPLGSRRHGVSQSRPSNSARR